MSLLTADDIQNIRTAARRLALILNHLVSEVREGSIGVELSDLAERLIAEAGGKPAFKHYGSPPFPTTLCVSINSCVVHGIPNSVPFKKGDIISLDLGMVYKGVYTDMARTTYIPPIVPKGIALIECATRALNAGIEEARLGNTTGDIGAAIQEVVESAGFGVVRDLAGHGVGRSLHEPPEVKNFGKKGSGEKLVLGQIIAIEPMITAGSWKVHIGDDKWSILTTDGSHAAHVEDMVLITQDGPEILTR